MEFRTPPISPLRQRMLEDMRMRKFQPHTQAGYIRAVLRLTHFLERSPDTATADDLRRFQVHLADDGATPSTINTTLGGLKFFFEVTVGHGEVMAKVAPVRLPQTLPVVLSREGVTRLLGAVTNLKHHTALLRARDQALRDHGPRRQRYDGPLAGVPAVARRGATGLAAGRGRGRVPWPGRLSGRTRRVTSAWPPCVMFTRPPDNASISSRRLMLWSVKSVITGEATSSYSSRRTEQTAVLFGVRCAAAQAGPARGECGAPDRGRPRARQLDVARPHQRRAALQPAEADRRKQREPARHRVDRQAGSRPGHRSDADRCRRRHVHDRQCQPNRLRRPGTPRT